MDRLGVQEEEKLLVLKYVSRLYPYIQQKMEFLTVNMLADAFHYTSKLEVKKRKSMFHDQADKSNIQQQVTSRFRQVKTPFSADLAKARSWKKSLLEIQKGT